MAFRVSLICPPPPSSLESNEGKCLVDSELKRHIQDFLANYVAITDGYAYGGVIPELSRGYAWNICYHFFQSNFEGLTAENPKQNLILQASAELSSYLAHFGMYTQGPRLINFNKHIFYWVISDLMECARSLGITQSQDKFTAEQVAQLIKQARQSLEKTCKLSGYSIRITDTLVSKILLGIFACTPAIDQHFKRAMKVLHQQGYTSPLIAFPTFSGECDSENTGVSSTLEAFQKFYQWAYNQDVQDGISAIKPSNREEFSFSHGLNVSYPTMRKLDLFFWSLGLYLKDKQSSHKATS